MPDGQRYRKLFHQALRIRLVEQKLIELYPTDKIQSPVHLSSGQDAVAVGDGFLLGSASREWADQRFRLTTEAVTQAVCDLSAADRAVP